MTLSQARITESASERLVTILLRQQEYCYLFARERPVGEEEINCELLLADQVKNSILY